MSKGLKITFLVHTIVAYIFGVILFFIPEIFADLFSWTPFDPNTTRLFAAAMLALATSSLLGYLAKGWEEVRIVVLMEMVFTVAAALGSLYGAIFLGAPWFIWVSFALYVIFAGAFFYFYFAPKPQASTVEEQKVEAQPVT